MQVPLRKSLQGHRNILPLGLFSGTLGSRRFSLFLLHERNRRRIRLCHFSTLSHIVAETAIVSFSHTAHWFPIANNLQEFFVHAVLIPDS